MRTGEELEGKRRQQQQRRQQAAISGGIVTAVEVTLDDGVTWQQAVIVAYVSCLYRPAPGVMVIMVLMVVDKTPKLPWQITCPISRLSTEKAGL